jgi:hypothetical protein
MAFLKPTAARVRHVGEFALLALVGLLLLPGLASRRARPRA